MLRQYTASSSGVQWIEWPRWPCGTNPISSQGIRGTVLSAAQRCSGVSERVGRSWSGSGPSLVLARRRVSTSSKLVLLCFSDKSIASSSGDRGRSRSSTGAFTGKRQQSRGEQKGRRRNRLSDRKRAIEQCASARAVSNLSSGDQPRQVAHAHLHRCAAQVHQPSAGPEFGLSDRQ